MKYFAILPVFFLCSIGHACDIGDMACVKAERNQSKNNLTHYMQRYNKPTYTHNQTTYLHGRYNRTPIETDNSGRNNRVYAHNTSVRGSGRASLVNINSSSYHNSGEMVIKGSGTIRNTIVDYSSINNCTAVVCFREDSSSSEINVNLNNANVYNYVR